MENLKEAIKLGICIGELDRIEENVLRSVSKFLRDRFEVEKQTWPPHDRKLLHAFLEEILLS